MGAEGAMGPAEGVVGGVLMVRVLGVPRPQPRARAVAAGGAAGRVRVVSTLRGSKADGWKRLVLAEVREAVECAGWRTVPAGVPVRLRLVFLFGTEKRERWGKYRAAVRNADFDNNAKLVADVLTVRGVFDDDGQVAVCEVVHVWSAPERAGCVIEVEALDTGAALPGAELW